MLQLRKKFPNELVVIGVHSAKFPSEHVTENIRQAVMRHGIEHPVVNDTGFMIWNSYTVNAWPTLVLIDPRGRIAGETSGEILAEEFAPLIQDVIDEHRDQINLDPLQLGLGFAAEPERPLRFPARLLISEKTMYIADTGHHRILEVKLNADGMGGAITRVFGSGLAGLKDGQNEQAQFSHPHGLGLKGSVENGTLYVADTENHTIRAIHLESGEVRTVAGTGKKAHGRLVLKNPTETPLRSPWAVLPLQDYVMVAMAGSHQIWVLINEAQLGPFAGNGYEALVDGPIGESSFNQPSDLALGLGYLFVADAEASAVRAISLNETPKTVTLVGQGLFDFGDKDGSTTEALLQHPTGLAFSHQSLYIADTYNHKIKKLDLLEGHIETLIGSGKAGLKDGTFEESQLFEPEGLQEINGRLYIADTNNHLIRVADLLHRQLVTFHLKGLEHLPVAATAETPVQSLPPVISCPGKIWVTLDVQLPKGYHRNAEMPTHLVVGQGKDAVSYTFNQDEDIVFPVEAFSESETPLDLTLYYCQDENAALCLIHNRSLILPVRAEETAGDHVKVQYPISN